MRTVPRILYNRFMMYYFANNIQDMGPLNNSGASCMSTVAIPTSHNKLHQLIMLMVINAFKRIQSYTFRTLISLFDRYYSRGLQLFFSQAIDNVKISLGLLLLLFQTVQQYVTINLNIDEGNFMPARLSQNSLANLDVAALQGMVVDGSKFRKYEFNQTAFYETVFDTYYIPVDE